LLNHLVVAIHVHEKKISLEIIVGKGGTNHDQQRLPEERLNIFSARGHPEKPLRSG
jgi:hypothetical protein